MINKSDRIRYWLYIFNSYGQRYRLAVRAERNLEMFSFKRLLEIALLQSKRIVQQTGRSRNTCLSGNSLKLNESQLEAVACRAKPKSVISNQHCLSESSAVSTLTQSSGGIARVIRPVTTRLLQGLFRKVSAPLWTDAKRKSAKRLFGETAPYFALVGVTLVSGPERGLLTAQDELEAICGDIREAISRIGWIHDSSYWQHHDSKPLTSTKSTEDNSSLSLSLENFEIGSPISKGCNAVVYSAKWKNGEAPWEEQDVNTSSTLSESSSLSEVFLGPEQDSILNSIMAAKGGIWSLGNIAERSPDACNDEPIGGIESEVKRSDVNQEEKKEKEEEFPLAVKMMFNYEAASNAPAILNAMRKEVLPAKRLQLDEGATSCTPLLSVDLGEHVNIVQMPCAFVDRMVALGGAFSLYPQALPPRINPEGLGRNMSLFCVMKKYDCTLEEYLRATPPSPRASLLLLTQLLEGVLHLSKRGVSHRDLKSDNILLDLRGGHDSPRLVVTDFGCSVIGKVPFPSFESDPRAGNAALMPPEIKSATPGLLTWLNYESTDLWAVGAIAYEIFGGENPFISTRIGSMPPLDSASFKESQIPRLPKGAPSEVRSLVADMLKRNPKQRPSTIVAVTLCQLSLWAPKKWLNKHALSLPSQDEVMRWLLCVSTKVICEAGSSGKGGGAQLEYEVISTFLRRVKYPDILEAIRWNRAF